MSEHTKGKLTVDGWNGRAGMCIWDKDLNHIITVERLPRMKLVDQQELAEELLSRWNSHVDLMGLLDNVIGGVDIDRGAALRLWREIKDPSAKAAVEGSKP